MTEATETAVAEIGAILSEEIANLGYPVGMGLAPSPEFIERVEQRIVRTCATALANRRTDTAVVGEGLWAAANKLVNEFAWSAVKADCTESREYLTSLIEGVRAALTASIPDSGEEK